MVTEKLLDFFFSIISGFLDLLPSISWDVNTSGWQYFKDILDMICFMLPINTITSIALLIFDLAIFRAFVALIRTLKSMIPFIG